MSDHGRHDAHAAHGGHHVNYVKVWAWLVALLVVSVVGPMLEIRVITLITAFGVALVKAYIVARNFMHLNVEKKIVHWALGAALILMVLLYGGVAPDVEKGTGQNWRKDAGWHEQGSAGAHGDGADHEAGGEGSEHGTTGH
jgi:caa(3)-type oxidase subunit IV